MKIALVDGQRREAEPGLSGVCPGCGSPMVPKCGELRIRHWAHHGKHVCDHWWERETQWHRDWKNKFPVEWQEIVHHADSGEKHIADVKTAPGCVIEFQHSYLKPEERRVREAFYKPMIWVVDGLRRIKDKPSFYEALNALQVVNLGPLTYSVPSNQCALLRDWADSRVAVFFDFGTGQQDLFLGVPVLWRLNPTKLNGDVLLSPVPVANFVEALLNGAPLKGMHARIIERRVTKRARMPYKQHLRPSRWPTSFGQYMARKRRRRWLRRM